MKYCRPADDAAQLTGTTCVGSAEDSGYPADNAIDPEPAKPAKLTTTSGTFTITLPTSTAVLGVALLYHNIAAGVSCSMNGEAITIPTWREDGYATNALKVFASPITGTVFTLTVGTNTEDVVVGRIWLITTRRTFDLNFLADPTPEVEEEHGDVWNETALGVELPFTLGGPRRTLTVQFKTRVTQATELQALRRYVAGRYEAFLAWPFDATDDEPWIVRFTEKSGVRGYEYVRHTFPFRAKECSRGLPWP